MTKVEQLAWRQHGFRYGRYGRGLTLAEARERGGVEAVRAYLQGKRTGERERELGYVEQGVSA